MAYDRNIAEDNYEHYRFCYENGHNVWVERARKCFDFWNGDQWDPADLAKLKASGRPALTFNVVGALVRTMKGLQRALRNDVRFAPVEDATAQDAAVRDALWLDIQNQNHLDFVESEIWERGMIMGRAYYDCRVDFDDNLKGSVKICSRRSQDVVLDPAIDSYDTVDWPQVYTRRWVNKLDIEHMAGKAAADELTYFDVPSWYAYEDKFMAQRLGRLPLYLWRGIPDSDLVRAFLLIDRQYYDIARKEVFVDTQTGDTSEIPPSWDRNRIAAVLQAAPGVSTMKRNVKTLRWRVTCEGQVLHDAESPYKRMTVVPFFPEMIEGVSKGAVEDLLDPQLLFNKVTSQELHIINTTANSGYKLKSGSLRNMTVEELETSGSKTGLVVELDNIQDLEKLTPNSVPSGHDRLSFKADSIMRDLSGVSQQARGFAREDVAGQAILANQAASDLNFGSALANLHRTKQMLAELALSMAEDYYTETRTLLINRGSVFRPQIEQLTLNQPTPEGTVLNDITKGRYSTVLIPSPTRSTLTEGEFDQLFKLRTELGVQIPDTVFIELSNAPNKAQIIQQMQGDSVQNQQEMQQQQAQAQQMQAQLMQAKVQKEQSAAELNSARAAKAQGEAGVDPDASYERVEMARIAAQHQTDQQRVALDAAKLGLTRRQHDQHAALQLTKMDHDRGEHARDRAHESLQRAGDRAASAQRANQKQAPQRPAKNA